MTVLAVERDPVALTFTIVSEFDAPAERVWQVWADPRQLERWWGPPTYPATVVDHDLTPGGWVTYSMTGPDGEKYHATSSPPQHHRPGSEMSADPGGTHQVPVHVRNGMAEPTDAVEVRGCYPNWHQLLQQLSLVKARSRTPPRERGEPR